MWSRIYFPSWSKRDNPKFLMDVSVTYSQVFYFLFCVCVLLFFCCSISFSAMVLSVYLPSMSLNTPLVSFAYFFFALLKVATRKNKQIKKACVEVFKTVNLNKTSYQWWVIWIFLNESTHANHFPSFILFSFESYCFKRPIVDKHINDDA